MKHIKRFFVIILAIILLVTTINPLSSDIESSANFSGVITGSVVNFRSSPSFGDNYIMDGSDRVQLYSGQQVTVLDTSNPVWYKIEVNYKGSVLTGYVSSDYIYVYDAPPEQPEESIPSNDAAFEAYLTEQGFPESYKNSLRALHERYPSWEFKAIHTGIEWNDLLANECNKQGQVKNLVQSPSYAMKYNWLSTKVGYDFAKDEYYPFDGSNWYAASDELVTYYLDPRSYLDETHIFAFESLSYQENTHNIAGIEAILAGSFMHNTKICDATSQRDPDTRLYSEVILQVARDTGVSPYHLASRMTQEMGNSNGDASNGSYIIDGVSYYNYFNIGAYDGSNALEEGMKYAANINTPTGSYGRPWNTVQKSIAGGATFLGEDYIQRGQNTLYTQKFDVVNADDGLFWRQYMTNVQAPSTECERVYTAYANNNLLTTGLTFNIPVYLNMPAVKSVKPSSFGSPNNWLKTLNIEGYSLTPSFGVNWNNDYSLIVPINVESITISGSTVNANARIISGMGNIALAEGTNYINIDVVAENGSVRTYNLSVIRGSASAGNTPAGGSGKGDLNGDGKITTIDIVKVQRLIVGLDAMSEERLAVADVNGDGKVSTIDIVKIQRHIVGLELIP